MLDGGVYNFQKVIFQSLSVKEPNGKDQKFVRCGPK